MSSEPSTQTDVPVRLTLRQSFATMADRLGPMFEGLLVLAAGPGILLVFTLFGHTPSEKEYAEIIATSLVGAITAYLVQVRRRHHAILIEATLSYVLHGGRAFLDELLGRMITGRWRREEIKPGQALFRVLGHLCEQTDSETWELKRRVTEALPTLGQIDGSQAMKLAGLLRNDFEPAKWRSDLRRRTVEALTTPSPVGHHVILSSRGPNEIRPLLQLREKDEIFTAMAVDEVLSDWQHAHDLDSAYLDIINGLRQDLSSFAGQVYKPEELEALKELESFLTSCRMDVLRGGEMLEEMAKSSNVYVRIAAARNVWRLSDRLPEKALTLMASFADSAQPVNVRRPVAKERSLELVIGALKSGVNRAVAEGLLWKLLKDPDEIIRVTAFDKLEALKDSRNDLLRGICDYLRQNERSTVLLERVARMQEDLPAHA